MNDETKSRTRKTLVQCRSFCGMLEKSIRAYQNRAIESAQIIEELIELARRMREANRRGEDLKLTEDKLAFYDALETNDSMLKVLGDATLQLVAEELRGRPSHGSSLQCVGCHLLLQPASFIWGRPR